MTTVKILRLDYSAGIIQIEVDGEKVNLLRLDYDTFREWIEDARRVLEGGRRR